MILRTQYLERIRPFYDSELIKVITGVRRCGKSVLLKQIAGEIRAEHFDQYSHTMADEDKSVIPRFVDSIWRSTTQPTSIQQKQKCACG